MNIWVATGRTTDDIELRYTQDQLAVGSFTLAVDDGYGDKKTTSFFRCSIFGKRAETLEKYVKKGMKILVSGRPKQDSWEDKEGHKRTAISFVVTGWEFAQISDQKIEKQPKEEPKTDAEGFMNLADAIDEELPFI